MERNVLIIRLNQSGRVGQCLVAATNSLFEAVGHDKPVAHPTLPDYSVSGYSTMAEVSVAG